MTWANNSVQVVRHVAIPSGKSTRVSKSLLEETTRNIDVSYVCEGGTLARVLLSYLLRNHGGMAPVVFV